MAFISLGEALDRVLEKLAVERSERKTGEVISLAGKCVRAEGEENPARLESLGCGMAPDGGAASRIRLAPEPRSARRPSGE